jgi:hypothetical protein
MPGRPKQSRDGVAVGSLESFGHMLDFDLHHAFSFLRSEQKVETVCDGTQIASHRFDEDPESRLSSMAAEVRGAGCLSELPEEEAFTLVQMTFCDFL